MRSGELDIQTNKHLALYSSSSTGCKDQMKPNHLKLLTKAEAMFQNFEQNPNSWFQDFPQKNTQLSAGYSLTILFWSVVMLDINTGVLCSTRPWLVCQIIKALNEKFNLHVLNRCVPQLQLSQLHVVTNNTLFLPVTIQNPLSMAWGYLTSASATQQVL